MTNHIPTISDLNDRILEAGLRQRIDNKTKPMGSLGQIEDLALRIGQILGTDQPRLHAPQMLVFAGDHGLADRGVSAFPKEVTWQMVQNFLSGGAAVNVLSRQHGLAVTVVDAGVCREFEPHPGLQRRKIGLGTADASQTSAMTPEQCAQALAQGREVVRDLPGNAILLGEMGIGNTSSAALLLSRLTAEPIEACVGRGTGLHDEGLRRKLAILQEVLARHADATGPLAALTAFGGFEIAMMTGAVLQAALERRVIVVDGFIASSAVLVAAALQPKVLQRCVFAHQSDEAGHGLMLKHLGATPLLRLNLRLGEGSGAALAWPLLDAACRILCEMASFESAGVATSGQDKGEPA
jgi:nicotinate-nucleotide--dimethylbenzimidazole phosphoribosyltransferase